MRTVKELFQIVIDSLKKGDKEYYYNNGICGEINDLFKYHIITFHESRLLMNVLKLNKPCGNQYPKFYYSEDWVGGAWWWDFMHTQPKTRQIRIAFLEEVIKNLDNNENNIEN